MAFDIADPDFTLAPVEKTAMAIIMSEFNGNKFDWDRLEYVDNDT